MPQLAYVTGDKEVDAVLKQFEPKFQKKYGRKAARDTAKKGLAKFRARAPVDTGALRDSAKVRAAKRSRRYAFGAQIYIDRDLLIKKAQKLGKRLSKDKRRGGEPFFYPSVVEFGDKDTEARFPLRKALFDNREAMKGYFLEELKRQLGETKPLRR